MTAMLIAAEDWCLWRVSRATEESERKQTSVEISWKSPTKQRALPVRTLDCAVEIDQLGLAIPLLSMSFGLSYRVKTIATRFA